MSYKLLLSKRIKKILLEVFNDNASRFAKNIGVTEGSVRGYAGEKKRKDGSVKIVTPSAEVVACIAQNLGINSEWLLFEKGEMFNNACNENKDNSIDIAIKLGEQINENKHLHEKNMTLSEENKRLKYDIEQLKNTRKRSVDYSTAEISSLRNVAEPQVEYKKTAK